MSQSTKSLTTTLCICLQLGILCFIIVEVYLITLCMLTVVRDQYDFNMISMIFGYVNLLTVGAMYMIQLIPIDTQPPMTTRLHVVISAATPLLCVLSLCVVVACKCIVIYIYSLIQIHPAFSIRPSNHGILLLHPVHLHVWRGCIAFTLMSMCIELLYTSLEGPRVTGEWSLVCCCYLVLYSMCTGVMWEFFHANRYCFVVCC
jgi:hypothetical protein